MSDGEALLRAILAHPDEDVLRVVYADWLDEHGQPVRAEFIRVQCEIARLDMGGRQLPMGVGRDELFKREACLIRNNWDLWVPFKVDGDYLFAYDESTATVEVGNQHSFYTWERGFVSAAVYYSQETFTEAVARELFTRHPVAQVSVSNPHIFPSGGNDTYYLGGLGVFPSKYWRRLDSLPTRSAVRQALNEVCLEWGRSLAGLPPLAGP